MRTLFQRVIVAIVSTVVLATAGALGGYVLGHAYALRQAEARLDQYANRLLLATISSTSESRAMLETMNASPYAMCSDAEIEYFRQLIFQSQFLKAAGRMHNGQIECSTTSGRNPFAATTRYSPVMSRQDGTSIYKNLPPFRVDDQSVVAVQQGQSFIVYNPYNFASMAAPPMHFTATAIDSPRHQAGQMVGENPKLSETILTHDGRVKVGDTLFATRCSKQSDGCLTAYISMTDALAMNRGYSLVFIALGAVFGALSGLICPMVYSRNKSVEQQLIRAIRADALTVVYQPIVELSTGNIVEAEALVRWTDEYKNTVSPDVFVKIAEEKGFVGEITKLVLRHALRDFGATLRARPSFRVNINIAAADLADSNFIPMLDQQLADAEVSPRNLGVEITESYTARQQIARNTILRLRQRGHYVAIDDFGTGYSSLSHLARLPVKELKIDRSFMANIEDNEAAQTLVTAVIRIGESLKLRVVAEGVESDHQRRFLEALGCDVLQGFLFGEAMPPMAFAKWLELNQRQPVRGVA